MTIKENLSSNYFSDKFPLLALDTSGASLSVSVFTSFENYVEINSRKINSHNESLFIALSKALELTNLKAEDLKLIIVSNGPGSFTGLRVGLAAAKGLAFGLNIGIILADTFEALAFSISRGFERNEPFYLLQNTGKFETIVAKFFVKSDGKFEILEDKKLCKINILKDILEKDIFKFQYLQNLNDKASIEADNLVIIENLRASDIAKYVFEYFKPEMVGDLFESEPFYFKEFMPGSKK